MNSVRRLYYRWGLTILIVTAVLLVGGLVLLYGASSFLPGMSKAELQIIDQARSGKTILHNPLWLPFKIPLWALLHTSLPLTYSRYISGIFAMILIASFYYICSKWYSVRVAVLATCLFALSSTTILLARVGTAAILLYAWLGIAAAALWFRHSKLSAFTPAVVLLAFALTMYVPGAIWFVGLLAIWFWRDIPHFFKHTNTAAVSIAGFLGALVLLPLGYAFYLNHGLVYDWLLLPHTLDPGTSLETLKHLPGALFYKSNLPTSYSLGTLPLLDAFSGTMLLLGLYAYRGSVRLQRTMLYLVAAVVSTTLAVLNNNQVYIFMLLPFLYLLIAGGLSYMLSEWRLVFPRNPIARFIGTIIVSIAVLSACGYHLNRYFLAWYNAPETRSVYNQKP